MVNHQVQIMATKKLTLKLLVDKKRNKVLFAESNKDFIDFLFSLMSIPIGAVIRILSKQKMVGCLGDLYQSIENLNQTYMQPNQNKDSILKTKSVSFTSNSNTLLMISDEPDTTSSQAKKYYKCSYCNSYVTDSPMTHCPAHISCLMNTEVIFVASSTWKSKKDAAESMADGGGGGFVKGVVTYMVMNDLVVMPMSTISSITLLNKFNVQDVGTLEEKVVYLGMDEGLKLLEASLQSKNVLTEVFLGKKM